jgi:ABC transport system ATP-binding/permease protein
LRVLEEALIAFPGVVCVVSHDRYFLNRVCTDILAFEGDGKIHHSVGDYDYYLEKKQRASLKATPAAREPAVIAVPNKPAAPGPAKPRKMSFKETRELEGMEKAIKEVEAEIARIENLFAEPDFHRTYAKQADQLVSELAAAKANLEKLFLRWEELEAIRATCTAATS